MKRTKMVQVIKGGKSIDERIEEAMKQYEISEDSLIEIKKTESEGRTTALIVYDPNRRILKGKQNLIMKLIMEFDYEKSREEV